MKEQIERNFQVAKMALTGEPLSSVGRKFGISGQRVYQITRKICRHVRQHHDFPKIPPDNPSMKSMRKNKEAYLRFFDKYPSTKTPAAKAKFHRGHGDKP